MIFTGRGQQKWAVVDDSGDATVTFPTAAAVAGVGEGHWLG